MKKYKKLLILLGVLIVIVTAVIIISNLQKKQEAIRVSGETILTVNEANATAIVWNSEENNFAFHRGSDGKWLYDKDAEFPVNQDEVEDVFDLFRELTAAFVIENVTDFAQYGLKDPLSTITITTTERAEDLADKETQARGEKSTDGESRDIRILIGAFSVMDEQRYISIGDGNVYLVKKDPYETLNVPESMMIANDKIPYFSNISTAQVKARGGETWTIGYDKEHCAEFSYVRDDSYYFEIGGKKLMVDPTITLNYFTDVVNSLFENYVNYKVRDEELSQYGLDDPEYDITINTVTKNNDGTVSTGQVRFSISKDPSQAETPEAQEEETAETFKAYLRVEGSKIIYLLDKNQYDKLSAVTYTDLRYKKLMPADFGDVESIDFTVDGETYTITSAVEENIRRHYFNGNALNMNNLKNAVAALTASEFTDEPFDGPEELKVVFHLSSKTYPTVTLSCLRKDGNQSVVCVDGKPTAYVLRTRVNSLREALIKISLGNDVEETSAAASN